MSSQEVPQGWTEYRPPALFSPWPDSGKNVAMKIFDHSERSNKHFGIWSVGKGRWYVFKHDGQAGGEGSVAAQGR